MLRFPLSPVPEARPLLLEVTQLLLQPRPRRRRPRISAALRPMPTRTPRLGTPSRLGMHLPLLMCPCSARTSHQPREGFVSRSSKKTRESNVVYGQCEAPDLLRAPGSRDNIRDSQTPPTHWQEPGTGSQWTRTRPAWWVREWRLRGQLLQLGGFICNVGCHEASPTGCHRCDTVMLPKPSASGLSVPLAGAP